MVRRVDRGTGLIDRRREAGLPGGQAGHHPDRQWCRPQKDDDPLPIVPMTKRGLYPGNGFSTVRYVTGGRLTVSRTQEMVVLHVVPSEFFPVL